MSEGGVQPGSFSVPEIPDYELLRPIGGGSYGDVWLARSATGRYRAVKVLVRSRFGEDSQPFEREFNGLKRFEPVSREHDALVDILHVGQQGEVLYYVMELADDAGRGQGGDDFDPEAYRPDTLAGRLKADGRLSLTECLEIARNLGEALSHLHASGLIHRDLKPSNIVFVKGKPCLADVGLVTARDATMSLVGTEGYIPPEGPGTEQADLFALGKILYETGTGLDRLEFPALPPWLTDDPARARWVEFNEMVLRCCEGDVSERYGSAAEFLADQALLEEGESLVARRRARRVWRGLRKGAALLAVAAVLLAIGSVFNPWRSEPEEQLRVLGALDVGEIRIPMAPYRSRAWDASPDGSRLIISTSTGPVVWDWVGKMPRPLLDENPEGGWTLFDFRWLTDHQVVCLGFRPNPQVRGAEQSVIYMIDPKAGRIDEVIYRAEHRIGGLSVTPDGRLVFVGLGSGSQGISCLTIGEEEPEVWVPRHKRWFGWPEFSPDRRLMAVMRRRDPERERGQKGCDIWLIPYGGGTPVRVTDRDGFDGYPVWAPDGKSLLYLSGSSIWSASATRNVWQIEIDLETGRPEGKPRRLTRYSDAQVRQLGVVPSTGKVIFGLAKDRTVIHSGATDGSRTELELAVGRKPQISRDGAWVYYLIDDKTKAGLYRMRSDGTGDPQQLIDGAPLGFDVSEGEIVVAMTSEAGAEIVRLEPASSSLVAVTPISGLPETTPRWSPDRQWIAYADESDLVVVDRDGHHRRVLGSIALWEPWTIQWSPDGSFLAGVGEGISPQGDQVQAVFAVPLEEGGALRNITPWEEDRLKEGLVWHPEGEWLTYVYQESDADTEIRKAYPDGRATEVLLDQDDDGHWDHSGTWNPQGTRFHFESYANPDGLTSHVFDPDSEVITHSSFPTPESWSQDGSVVVWTVKTMEGELWLAELP